MGMGIRNGMEEGFSCGHHNGNDPHRQQNDHTAQRIQCGMQAAADQAAKETAVAEGSLPV